MRDADMFLLEEVVKTAEEDRARPLDKARTKILDGRMAMHGALKGVSSIRSQQGPGEAFAQKWKEERNIPDEVDGKPVEVWQGPDLRPSLEGAPASPRAQIERGKRVATGSIEDALEGMPQNGATVSVLHYYRNNPVFLQWLFDKFKEAGIKNITLTCGLFYGGQVDCLAEAMRDETLGRIEGAVYGPMGNAISRGRLPYAVQFRGYGARNVLAEQGRLRPDITFAPVPYVDSEGRVSGVMGNPETWCGSGVQFIGTDALHAGQYICVPQVIGEPMQEIPGGTFQRFAPDFIVNNLPTGTLSTKGFGGGTLDETKFANDPTRVALANNIISTIIAAGLLRNGVNYQFGAGGSNLMALRKLTELFAKHEIVAGNAVGGHTSASVQLLRDGFIERLLDGQLFVEDEVVGASLRDDSRHTMVDLHSLMSFANPNNTYEAEQDFFVGGLTEVDVNFNGNTVTGADGIIRTGLGGGQDSAASKLGIFALTLAGGKEGRKAFPKVVSRVNTVSTPSCDVDVVVTEEGIAINPKSKSPYVGRLREAAASNGLAIIDIATLAERAMTKARDLAGPQGRVITEANLTNEIVALLYSRDGSRVLDVIRKVAA